MKVAIYARISVTTDESVSVARQLNSCRKYAEARGWGVVGEFVDDGVSATANRPEDRKGWSALLATGGFNAVVIWKVDRLTRKVLDFLNVDAELQKRGAGLIAVEDPIDMTTAQGRAFATILAVFGEMEAENIRARVKAARAHIINEGRWPGGGVPYGYKSIDNPDGPGRYLTIDFDRHPWLTRIVFMALGGMPVNAIATQLTRDGAPPPAKAKQTESYTWNRQTVIGLLRNPILAGMTSHNPGRAKSGAAADPFAILRDEHGQPVVKPHLAILTVEDFRKLQHRLDARDTPQARPRAERLATCPMFAGIVKCAHCDKTMYRGTNQKKAMLYCPRCRQTLTREHFDAHIIERLHAERDAADEWARAGTDPDRRRMILEKHIESLRIRRGRPGIYFDPERVLLQWRELPAVAA